MHSSFQVSRLASWAVDSWFLAKDWAAEVVKAAVSHCGMSLIFVLSLEAEGAGSCCLQRSLMHLPRVSDTYYAHGISWVLNVSICVFATKTCTCSYLCIFSIIFGRCEWFNCFSLQLQGIARVATGRSLLLGTLPLRRSPEAPAEFRGRRDIVKQASHRFVGAGALSINPWGFGILMNFDGWLNDG